MSLLLVKLFQPKQPSTLNAQQTTHSSHFTHHVSSSSPRHVLSKFITKNSKKTHEANIRTGFHRKSESFPTSSKLEQLSLSDIWKGKFPKWKISSPSVKNGSDTEKSASVRNSTETALLPAKLQQFSETNIITNDSDNLSMNYDMDEVISCLNDRGKVDVATETKPELFVMQNNIDSFLPKSNHPSGRSKTGTTYRLRNGKNAEFATTEVLNKKCEAILKSLQRSLKKHRPRNTIYGRTILTQGVSVAIRNFNPLHSYKKLSLKRFNDERNFVEQKLNTFVRISDLGMGRKFVKVCDLKCCKYFHQLHIIQECRLMNLQRPKKKPLHEYYNDDDAELEGYFFQNVFFFFYSQLF
ncbi:unnamed protein product [Onchocerca flexuosa]|uniref:Uncharacterized protein n=1 Tax=Onchocerca flexuosa TaxID=387005 RepID=A0A183HNP0_9BILA|nr:unnamed protein product [Onchocerca flexuosa]